MGKQIITPIFQASFVKLFKPDIDDQGREVYSMVAVFDPKENFDAMKEICMEALLKEWGTQEKIPSWYQTPFKQGVPKQSKDVGFDLVKHPYYEGKIIVNLKSIGMQPDIIYANKEKVRNPRDVYSGMWARASVQAFAFGASPKKKVDKVTGATTYVPVTPGVSFSLQNVQKIRDGEPLGAVRTKAEDDFTAFEEPSAPANTQGLFGFGTVPQANSLGI